MVEDDENVRDLVTRGLCFKGYNVLDAPSGEEALIVLKKHEGSLDLLITDVVMPGMSGRQLNEKIKSLFPEVKVLYISGYTENTIVRHGALDAGAHFLQKPFAPEALASKVREVIDAG